MPEVEYHCEVYCDGTVRFYSVHLKFVIMHGLETAVDASTHTGIHVTIFSSGKCMYMEV